MARATGQRQEKYDLIQETEDDEKVNLDDSLSLPIEQKLNQKSNESGYSAHDLQDTCKERLGSLEDLPQNVTNLQIKQVRTSKRDHSNSDVFLPETDRSQNSFDGQQFQPSNLQSKTNLLLMQKNSSEYLSLQRQANSEQQVDDQIFDGNITQTQKARQDCKHQKQSRYKNDYFEGCLDEESLSLGRSTEIKLVGNLLTPKEEGAPDSKGDQSPFNLNDRSFPSPCNDLGENGPNSGKNNAYLPNSQEEQTKFLNIGHTFSEIPQKQKKTFEKVDPKNNQPQKDQTQNVNTALLLPLELTEYKNQEVNSNHNAINIQVAQVKEIGQQERENQDRSQVVTKTNKSHETNSNSVVTERQTPLELKQSPQEIIKNTSPATQSSIFGQVEIPVDVKKRTQNRRRNPIIQVDLKDTAQTLPNKQKVQQCQENQDISAFKIQDQQIKDNSESAPLWTPPVSQKAQNKTSRFLNFFKGKLGVGDTSTVDKSQLLDSKTALDLNIEQSQQRDFDVKNSTKQHSISPKSEDDEEHSIDLIGSQQNQRVPGKHQKLLQHDQLDCEIDNAINPNETLLTLDKGFRRSEGGGVKGQVRSCRDTDQSTEENIFDLAKLTEEKGCFRSERGGASVDNDRKYESEGIKLERQERQDVGRFSIENQILQYDRAISEDQQQIADFQFNQFSEIFTKNGAEINQNNNEDVNDQQSDDGSECPFAFDHKAEDFTKISRDLHQSVTERNHSDFNKRINNGYQMMDCHSQNEQQMSQKQFNESKIGFNMGSQNADLCTPFDLNVIGGSSPGIVRGQTFSSGEITRTRTTNSLGRGAARTQTSPYLFRGSEEIQFQEIKKSQIDQSSDPNGENSIFVTDTRRLKSVSHLQTPTNYNFGMTIGQKDGDIWQESNQNNTILGGYQHAASSWNSGRGQEMQYVVPQNQRNQSSGFEGVSSQSSLNSNEAVRGALQNESSKGAAISTETSHGFSSGNRASNPFFQISGAKEFIRGQNLVPISGPQTGQNQTIFNRENERFQQRSDSYTSQQKLNYQEQRAQFQQDQNPFNMVPYQQVDEQFQRRNMSDSFCHSQLAVRSNDSQSTQQRMSGSGSWPHTEQFINFTPEQQHFGMSGTSQRLLDNQPYQIAQPNFSAKSSWPDNSRSSDLGSVPMANPVNNNFSPQKLQPAYQMPFQAFPNQTNSRPNSSCGVQNTWIAPQMISSQHNGSLPFNSQIQNDMNKRISMPQITQTTPNAQRTTTHSQSPQQNSTAEIQQVCPRHGPVPQDPFPSDSCCLSKASILATQSVNNGEIALKQFEIVKKQIIQEQKLHSVQQVSQSGSQNLRVSGLSNTSGSQVSSTNAGVGGGSLISGSQQSNPSQSKDKQGSSNRQQKGQGKGKNQHVCCCCCFQRGNLLHQMTGYASDFCKDQQCSRYIQDLIYQCPQTPPQVLESFYREICEDELFLLNNCKNFDAQEKQSQGKSVQSSVQNPNGQSIMYNAFGNFVVQMILEHAKFETKLLLSECIIYQVRQLTFDKYGCRIVQKALEQFDWEKQKQIIEPLDEELLVKGMFDELGNHVVQKIITKCPIQHTHFVVDLAQRRIVQLCMDQNGCRIVQRILERIPRQNIKQLIDVILKNVKELTPHKFGNYVLTHIMQYGLEEEKIEIIDQIIDQLIGHSIDKLGSNVVESCLRFAPESRKKLILDKIVGVQIQSSDENNLTRMINNDYGNYVVQIAYEISNFDQREKLQTKFFKAVELELINPNRGFAKHVFNKIKQEDAKSAQILPQKSQNFMQSQPNSSQGSAFKKTTNNFQRPNQLICQQNSGSMECRDSVHSDRAQQSDDNTAQVVSIKSTTNSQYSGSLHQASQNQKDDQNFVKKGFKYQGTNSFKNSQNQTDKSSINDKNYSAKASSNSNSNKQHQWGVNTNNSHSSSSSAKKGSTNFGAVQTQKWHKK